jgi:hypothetical protein
MVSPSVVAALVTFALGILGAAARYVFDVRLVRDSDIEDEYGQRFDELSARLDTISNRLDEQDDQLSELESLVVGNDYDASNGLVELIEENTELSRQNLEHIRSLERDIQRLDRGFNREDDD